IEPTVYDDEAICMAIGISEKNIPDATLEKYFAIAPNPTDGDISFVAKQTCEETTQVEVYNALGQQVATTILPAYESVTIISLAWLNTGIYFVQFKQNNVILQTEKLTIIH
ncbi:MAG TPA: T9SS type A sorting domain-containing protein, partial [Chitinophagales bacterium]|nr:T9SS type A sorting domain-containing protein [Chitinophagales bacterium]